LPPAKPAKAAGSEPTGINFVDLLIKKKDEEEPPGSRHACSNSIPSALWFSAAGAPPTAVAADRRKVESADVRQALTDLGAQARYNQLRQQIMTLTDCSKRTAQMAITAACQQGSIVQTDGHYRLPG
jgi:hypothetical protein